MATTIIVGDRPDHVPADHLIFNAPRPLYGAEWTGDFVHGIFYASVDPADSDKIKRNEQLDGTRIEYISAEEHAKLINEWFDAFVAEEYPDEDFSHIGLENRHHMYCEKNNKRIIYTGEWQ